MPTKKIKSSHKQASSSHPLKGKGLGDPLHGVRSYIKRKPRKPAKRIGSAVG